MKIITTTKRVKKDNTTIGGKMPKYHSNEFPWYAPSDQTRRDNAIQAAKLMMNAAFTAPTTGGVDHNECELLWGEEEQEELAGKMDELSHTMGNEKTQELYQVEAVMAREADCILLVGDTRSRNTPFDADCGFCGGAEGCAFLYSRRKTSMGQIDSTDQSLSQTPIDGPLCGAHVSNLGFSVGSALWMARNLMVDARPFMTMGVAAKKLGYCKKSALVVGIPIAATSKNPFVDVHFNYPAMNMRSVVDSARKSYIITRQFGLDYRLHSSKNFKKNSDNNKED